MSACQVCSKSTRVAPALAHGCRDPQGPPGTPRKGLLVSEEMQKVTAPFWLLHLQLRQQCKNLAAGGRGQGKDSPLPWLCG